MESTILSILLIFLEEKILIKHLIMALFSYFENVHFAVLSGCCAATASVIGKSCGLPMFQDYLLIRAVLFGLMIGANATVWTLFIKALGQAESSLVPTVISSASNYLFSALAGYTLFGERMGLMYWVGMSFIMFGLGLIVRDQKSPVKKD